MIAVGVDAAQHRLPGAARQRLDGEAQALGGVSVAASHRAKGYRAVAPAGERGGGRRRNGGCSEVARRFLVAAFGDAGHAFPAIALARALRRRGHEVLVETWERWREAVEAEGLGFTAAEEYKTLPAPAAGSADGASAADAALALLPLMEEFRPDVVVSDILTLAPALAAEKAGRAAGDADPARVSGARGGDAVLRVRGAAAADGGGAGAWRAGLPVLRRGCDAGGGS